MNNNSKGVLHKKLESMYDLEYMANTTLVGGVLQDWLTKSPDNEDLKKVVKSYIEITLYTNRLTMDRETFHTILSKEREAQNKLELELREVKEKLRILTLETKL